MLEFAAISRGQFPTEAETVHWIELMESFVRLLICEVQALCLLQGSTDAYGFFAPSDRVLETGPMFHERESLRTVLVVRPLTAL